MRCRSTSSATALLRRPSCKGPSAPTSPMTPEFQAGAVSGATTSSGACGAARMPAAKSPRPRRRALAGAAVASRRSLLPSTSSQLVPMSRKRAHSPDRGPSPRPASPRRCRPRRRRRREGKTTARARGCTFTPTSVGLKHLGEQLGRHDEGQATPRGSGSMPSTMWVIVALPARGHLVDVTRGATPPCLADLPRPARPETRVRSGCRHLGQGVWRPHHGGTDARDDVRAEAAAAC